MFENSFRWNAMYGIICEHLVEQIVSGIVEHFDLFTQLLLRPAWECFFVIGKWHYTWPDVIGWCFQDSNAVIEKYEWNSKKNRMLFLSCITWTFGTADQFRNHLGTMAFALPFLRIYSQSTICPRDRSIFVSLTKFPVLDTTKWRFHACTLEPECQMHVPIQSQQSYLRKNDLDYVKV